jgi:hypothetical protein
LDRENHCSGENRATPCLRNCAVSLRDLSPFHANREGFPRQIS